MPAATTAGKLREPVLRFVQWARAFNAASAADTWFGSTLDVNRLGQSPLRSPSVFNFFRPGYVPPNTALGAQGLVVPELQITNETTVAGYANFMQSVLPNGAGDIKAQLRGLARHGQRRGRPGGARQPAVRRRPAVGRDGHDDGQRRRGDRGDDRHGTPEPHLRGDAACACALPSTWCSSRSTR